MPLIRKLTNPEPYLPPSALKFTEPGTRKLEATPIAQSPLELFKLANPKLFTLPCLAFPEETFFFLSFIGV